MKALFGILLSFILILSVVTPVSAAQPEKAKPINPKVLEAVFIHYDKPVKPPKTDPELPPVDNDYFEVIGPKWDLSKYPNGMPFTINPSKAPNGADREIAKAFATWEAATTKSLFALPSVDYNSWWGARDGKNNISWQVLTSRTAIAATWIWYLDLDGNGDMSAGDEVIENDIVFNASLRWDIDADGEGTLYSLKNLYDVCNIATHEIGHVVGLDDLYDPAYRDLTMYGYGAKAEIKKISLEEGDMEGTLYLYP